jgi:hypothetical protein
MLTDFCSCITTNIIIYYIYFVDMLPAAPLYQMFLLNTLVHIKTIASVNFTREHNLFSYLLDTKSSGMDSEMGSDFRLLKQKA